METKYNRTEMKPTAYITDVYSEALASMYGYSNAFGAGTNTSFYSGTSINDVRTNYLTKTIRCLKTHSSSDSHRHLIPVAHLSY